MYALALIPPPENHEAITNKTIDILLTGDGEHFNVRKPEQQNLPSLDTKAETASIPLEPSPDLLGP